MKAKILALLLLVSLISGSAAFAAPITDTVQAPTGYFVPTDAQKNDFGTYWRYDDQDWDWQHSAIGGSFTTANLNISAYDVDAAQGEVDNIYLFDLTSNDWVLLGALGGANSQWAFTDFSLGSQWFDEIAAGLKVKIDIDATDAGWYVTLAKSSLSLDGGILPDPDPNPVPEPATMLLLGGGLLGLAYLKGRKN